MLVKFRFRVSDFFLEFVGGESRFLFRRPNHSCADGGKASTSRKGADVSAYLKIRVRCKNRFHNLDCFGSLSFATKLVNYFFEKFSKKFGCPKHPNPRRVSQPSKPDFSGI